MNSIEPILLQEVKIVVVVIAKIWCKEDGMHILICI